MDIRTYLKNNKLVTDGAFGTYYVTKGGKSDIIEIANTSEPELVKEIHREYIEAGAKLIRTNTFASNAELFSHDMEKAIENVISGYRLAKEVADEYQDVFVAADMGPIVLNDIYDSISAEKQYMELSKAFVDNGAEILMFETLASADDILGVVEEIKKYAGNDLFIIVQFCVDQYGFSNAGRSAKSLVEECLKTEEIDAVGFNCGVGPMHLYKIIEDMGIPDGKYITALPNAGYPKFSKNRMVFLNNENYFTQKELKIAELGVHIVGGCCGTTPTYIKKLAEGIRNIREEKNDFIRILSDNTDYNVKDNSFFGDKTGKLIAVELAPPLDSNDNKLMEAANYLKNLNVDVLTFPDSPSGRTRADSVLMASKVRSSTGMKVMPHICCRDKNAIAIRAQLLGAYMNDIQNFLIVTGDPVPTMIRQNVKSVFNFDSVGMMKMIKDMNSEQFCKSPVVYGGVINYDRLNLDVEIKRIEKKMEAGAKFFFTQPVFTKEDAEKIIMIKKNTGARILCGFMPLISRNNAIFIKNEMTGIRVTDEIVEHFTDEMSREDAENAGVEIVKNVMEIVSEYVDGYYFTFPFNRVYLLERILC